MNSQVTTGSQSDFTPWHAVAADEVIRRLDTNVQSGLSAANVQQRLEKYGHNRLPEGRKQGPFKRFFHRHELRPEIRDGIEGTVVRDAIEYDAGFGFPGRFAEKFIARQMQETFQYRQRKLEELLRLPL